MHGPRSPDPESNTQATLKQKSLVKHCTYLTVGTTSKPHNSFQRQNGIWFERLKRIEINVSYEKQIHEGAVSSLN